MLKRFVAYRPYFRPILRLSYPIIIGQIGFVLMGVTDIVMIGKLDATNLAAAGLANSVFFFVTILGIGTLSAISPLVAKSRGAGQLNETGLLYRQGILASVLLSVVLTIAMWFCTVNLEILGQEKDVTELTKPYLHLLNAGTLFMMVFMAAKQFSDGLSFTKPAAMITLGGLVLNGLLCWILIFGKFGFQAYGLNGAGYATTITRIIMAFAMVIFVMRYPVYRSYLQVKEKAGRVKLLRQIFKVGLPSGFQYFFEVGAFAFAAVMIGWFGKNELAAHQIAINLASVTYMVATGISVGGSIMVGEAWGRKNKTDLMHAGRAALIISVGFMFVMALVFAVGNRFLVGLYTPDPLVSGLAANLLLIASLFQLSDGVQCVSLGILRGISDTRIPTGITIIAYWVVGIPSGWWMASYLGMELYGIWFGLSLGLTFSAIFLSIRFLKESRAFRFEDHQSREIPE